jgi:hypothetical protein
VLSVGIGATWLLCGEDVREKRVDEGQERTGKAVPYRLFVDSAGRDFERDDVATIGSEELGGRVVVLVNDNPIICHNGGGISLDLNEWLKKGRNG